MRHARIGFITLASSLLILSSTTVALARQEQESEHSGSGRNSTSSPALRLTSTETATPSPTARTERESQKNSTKGKLEEAKVKVCEVKEKEITTRATQMTTRATTIETKFSTIASRVNVYYKTKLLPEGKTVSTYEALQTDITTKKVAVDTALKAAKADLASFSCTGSDPKGAMTTFRTDMQKVNSALKSYRDAIKNFTKALHQVVGDAAESSASPTPELNEQ
jgi:hypothetical protein